VQVVVAVVVVGLALLTPRAGKTWASPFTGAEPSLITLELKPEGADATQLLLVHSRLPESVAKSHWDGWGTMLDRLSGKLPAGAAP
jgi:uncharacterized protein YndB with AHSA1/START domain